MKKPKIFISHITEEKELAIKLKSYLELKFQNKIELFVSSDMESISLGKEWFKTIKNNLNQCDLMIVLCSTISIERPWINFEAGTASIRNIPVIPFCHSGLTPDKLYYPLKALQAGIINQKDDLKKMFNEIANINNSIVPEVNDIHFFEFLKNFELSSENLLLKKNIDSVLKLLINDLSILRNSIIGSTQPQNFTEKFEFKSYSFEFRQVEHLYNLSFFGKEIKIYAEALYDSINSLSNDIQFILSNRNLILSQDLTDLLYEFLFRSKKLYLWEIRYLIFDGKNKNKIDVTKRIEEIRNFKTTPDFSDGHYLANYLHFYKDLKFYQIWLVAFAELTSIKV